MPNETRYRVMNYAQHQGAIRAHRSMPNCSIRTTCQCGAPAEWHARITSKDADGICHRCLLAAVLRLGLPMVVEYQENT